MARLISMLEFLNGAKTAVTALRLRDVPGFEAGPDEPAFDAVDIYAHESIAAAIEDLRRFKSRLCFIVPAHSSFDNSLAGRVLTCRRTLSAVLLIADRNYGKRNAAAVGKEDTTPGVIALADLALLKLTGQRLGLPSICLEPTDGQPFTLSGDEKEDLPGREVWAQEFTTPAGELRADLGRPGTP